MRKIKYIFVLFLLLPVLTISQEKDVDALFEIWQDSTLTKKERLIAFHEAVEVREGPPNTKNLAAWYKAIDAAIGMSEETNNKNLIPRFLIFKVLYQSFFLGDQELSCPTATQALDLALEYNDYQSIFTMSFYFLASEGCNIEKYNPIAIEKIFDSTEKKILSLESSEKIKELLIFIYNLRGFGYESKSEYPKAIKFLQKAQSLLRELEIKDSQLATNLKSLGSIHLDIGNYVESEKYLLEAIEVVSHLNKLDFLGAYNNELSRLYLNTNQPEKALDAAIKAITIMEPEMKTDAACEGCVHESYTAEAGVYNLMGDYKTALEKLMKIKAYHDNPNSGASNYGYAFFFAELGSAYFGLKEYKKAIESATKSLSYATGTTLNETRRSYEIIYKSQEKLQNFSKAFKAFENYVTVKDSMAVLRNAQEVTRIELENTFQQEQLKNELTFQETLNSEKTKRNRTIVISIFAGLIALFLFYRLRLSQKTKNLLTAKNQQIEAEKAKAQASEKAKHQFLANMSHEIRTPMNAIKGMTDILIRRDPKNEQMEYLDGIKQSSDSLLVIINDILDISKIEAGKIELENQPFSIHDVVKNVETIMQFKAEEKGLQLQKNIPNENLTVKGDATRLRQILINLISNAIKFTEKGIVTTTIKSKMVGDKTELHFTVSDTGIGIDKDRIAKIFKSFEQAYSDTSRKFGGTGLGLSISKKLVKLHNGKIWVESEKGKGSQFHFTILYEMAEENIQEVQQNNSENNINEQLKGISILLAEDNHFNALVAQEELEDAIENVNVDVAENGAIAIKKLKSSTYDVILMDVQMPIMNGYEATQAIRKFNNNKVQTPIIAMTANVLKEEVDKCYEVGMNDFIGKPFDIQELINKIYNLVKV